MGSPERSTVSAPRQRQPVTAEKAGAIVSISRCDKPSVLATGCHDARHPPYFLKRFLAPPPEGISNRQSHVNVGLIIGLIDNVTEVTRPGSRVGIHVEGWREPSCSTAVMEKSVIAKVVVRVGDQHGENEALPQLTYVVGDPVRSLLDHLSDVEVAGPA